MRARSVALIVEYEQRRAGNQQQRPTAADRHEEHE
jgi:hypothetical protein